jgi:hypothetical protein
MVRCFGGGAKMKRILVMGAFALGLVGTMGGPAGADPTNAKKAQRITATCENGETVEVVTNGSGAFTASHDLNSTATYIPFAFSEFTGTVTDPDGNVLDSFTDPSLTKRPASNLDLVECPFSFSETDPEGFTFTGSGTAFVKIVGGR